MSLLGREPVRWIGIIVSCIIAVLSILTGEGVVSDALAGQITDSVNAIAQLLVILAPWLAAELSRRQVTPTASPALPEGSIVRVITPSGTPDKSAVL